MDDEGLLDTLVETTRVIRAALDGVADMRAPGERIGQYGLDLIADAPAVELLLANGLGVLSEESGHHEPDRAVCVVIDPVDGSTNASRGIPWYSTSLCAVDDDGALASVVVNQATGTAYTALRGRGAWRDGEPIKPSDCTEISSAMVAVNGLPARHLGWRQYRALGSAALDLCAVADGTIDGYVDFVDHSHAPWDYLGALLVLMESGAAVAEAFGEPMVLLDHSARRSPVAGATSQLLAELLALRPDVSAEPGGWA